MLYNLFSTILGKLEILLSLKRIRKIVITTSKLQFDFIIHFRDYRI